MKTEQLQQRIECIHRMVTTMQGNKEHGRQVLDELDHLEADLRALEKGPDVCTIPINETTLQHVQAIKVALDDSAPYINAPQSVQRALPLVNALEFEIRTALEAWKVTRQPAERVTAREVLERTGPSTAAEPGTLADLRLQRESDRRTKQLEEFTHTALRGLIAGQYYRRDDDLDIAALAVGIAAATVKRLNGATL